VVSMKLLRVKQVSELTGLHPSTFRDMHKFGIFELIMSIKQQLHWWNQSQVRSL